jgi:MFS family permease
VSTQNAGAGRLAWAGDRWALTAIFAVFGFAQGNWAVRIPWVADHLGLSAGELGLALIGPALGGIAAMPVAPPLLLVLGSRTVIGLGLAALGVAVALPALAPSLPWLVGALVVLGFTGGVVDVAANAQGIEVERARARPAMSGFHGGWSLGALIGAVSAGLVAKAEIDAPVHLAAVGVVTALAGIAATSPLRYGPPSRERGPAFALPSGATVLLGLIGFGILFTEAAVADWSAVFLDRDRRAGPATAAAGYAAFSVSMVLGRFAGDALTRKLGRRLVTSVGTALAGAGLSLAVLAPGAIASIPGFALAGLGTSCVLPSLFSAAGAAEPDEHRRTQALAAVATTSYLGWLAAPPMIGAVAQATNVACGLMLAAGLAIGTAALATFSKALDGGPRNLRPDN